jgi:hypothetical protein
MALLLLLLLQVSFNVANTPEQIYWNQKKVREAMAKAGGILPNSISYYQVRGAHQRSIDYVYFNIHLNIAKGEICKQVATLNSPVVGFSSATTG